MSGICVGGVSALLDVKESNNLGTDGGGLLRSGHGMNQSGHGMNQNGHGINGSGHGTSSLDGSR